MDKRLMDFPIVERDPTIQHFQSDVFAVERLCDRMTAAANDDERTRTTHVGID